MLDVSQSHNDMSQADVSVIIPTHNNEATIGRALASILLQERIEFEVIVVDDCSTDRTAEILAGFKAYDSRVRVLRAPTNIGEGLARNLGIQQATGTFVVAQDGDDISLPGRLRQQRDYLHVHPNIHWVATWAYTMTRTGRLLEAVTTPTNPEDIETRLINAHMCIVGASAMTRRKALVNCGGYHNVITPDYDLARRFVDQYQIGVLPSHLYAYIPALEARQRERYRGLFWLMLTHYREYGGSKTDARFVVRLLYNGLQGFIPFAHKLTGALRSTRHGIHSVTPPTGYETWLHRLQQLEHEVSAETMS